MVSCGLWLVARLLILGVAFVFVADATAGVMRFLKKKRRANY